MDRESNRTPVRAKFLGRRASMTGLAQLVTIGAGKNAVKSKKL